MAKFKLIDDPKELTKRERSTGERRLLKLARLLRSLPRRRFYYGTWVGHDWKGGPDLECGTTACALGWATTVKPWRQLGLRLQRPTQGLGAMVKFDGHREMDAGAAFFGLTLRESSFLFMPSQMYAGRISPGSHASNVTVARHIEMFVRNRDKLYKTWSGDWTGSALSATG